MNKDDLVFWGVTVGIGSLAGLGLSFTALSPLIIGAIVAGTFPALIVAAAIGLRCYYSEDINKVKNRGVSERRFIAALMPFFITTALTNIAAGVGLAAAASAILPGIFATWWAAAAGAVIGATLLPVIVVATCCVPEKFGEKILGYANNPNASLKDVYIGEEEERGYQPA